MSLRASRTLVINMCTCTQTWYNMQYKCPRKVYHVEGFPNLFNILLFKFISRNQFFRKHTFLNHCPELYYMSRADYHMHSASKDKMKSNLTQKPFMKYQKETRNTKLPLYYTPNSTTCEIICFIELWAQCELRVWCNCPKHVSKALTEI